MHALISEIGSNLGISEHQTARSDVRFGPFWLLGPAG